MPTHLPWADGDMGSIERALKRYQTAGLETHFDIGRYEQGIVTISQTDSRRADARTVIFEIHKLQLPDKPNRAHWVVQIKSLGSGRREPELHGCVSANALVFAVAKAEKDLQAGLTSTQTFDMAANSYWLK